MAIKTMGFPKIKNFGGDIRDFLPSLFQYLKRYDIKIYLEHGYGSGFGFTEQEYHECNPNVNFVSVEDVYQQDLVLILKMPELNQLEMLRDGNSIFTMCHYATRPTYVDLFIRKNINPLSMDAIVDDYGKRIFVDYFRTAFNGSKAAFEELKKSMSDFYSSMRRPLNVSILGVGMVAQNCAKSYEILGDEVFLDRNIPGIIIKLLPRTITYSDKLMANILKDTDILVDATNRRDSSQTVVKNTLLSNLPEHAIILDLTADRYEEEQVKPIEGTVIGNLQKYIIYQDDELYNKIPKKYSSTNRRINVSCNSWPGVTPIESIEYYEFLLKDYLSIIIDKGFENIDKESSNSFERALYKGTLENFLSKNEALN